MTDEKLPAGSTLTVTLRRKEKHRRTPAPGDTTATGDARSARGIIPLDGDEPQLFVRRGGKASLSFFDLGTRLRSIPAGFSPLEYRAADATDTPEAHAGYFNEYVEIETHFAGTYSETAIPIRHALTLSADEHEAYTRSLLGSLATGPPAPADLLDPLARSPANVTGRPVPHCENLVSAGTLDLLRITIGTIPLIPLVTKRREVAPGDASERWNAFNLTDARVPDEGTVEAKDVQGALRVESVFYRDFDTADAVNFKLTHEPRFEGEEAQFSIGKKPVSVYLVPALVAYQLANVVVDVGLVPVAQLAARSIPAYPTPYGTTPAFGCLLRRTPLAAFIGGANVLVTPQLANPAPAGSLVAGVVSEGGRVYVWRRTDAGAAPQDLGARVVGSCDF